MPIRSVLADPMLRMLALAIGLAIVVPVTNDYRPIAEFVSSAAVFVLFLLNGMRIARAEILAGLTNYRFLAPLVVWVFGAMALGGLMLSQIAAAGLPPIIAVGFLYLGTLPSTVQSATSYTSIAEGDVGLSVIGAAMLNLLGIVITVPLFLLLGGVGEGGVGWETAQRILLILLLPFLIGQAVQIRMRRLVTRYKSGIVWVDRCVIALAVYVAFSGAVNQGIWQTVDPAGWGWLAVLIAAFLAYANIGAWSMGRAIGLARRERISFLFAGAQKSAAVGVPLATILFAPEVAGFIVVPLLLYHLFQLVVAAPIAQRIRQAG